MNVSFLWGTTRPHEADDSVAIAASPGFSANLTGPPQVQLTTSVSGRRRVWERSFRFTATLPEYQPGQPSVGRTLCQRDLMGLGSASSVNVSFLWGTTPATTGGETPAVAMTATGAFSADLTGLTPGARYYFKAKAVGDGTAYGPVYSSRFSLRAPRVASRTTAAGAASITSTSATLNGHLLDLGSASSTDVSFIWGTTRTMAGGETTITTMNSPGTFSVALTGLTPGTLYFYRAKAVGDGTAYGSILAFRTTS